MLSHLLLPMPFRLPGKSRTIIGTELWENLLFIFTVTSVVLSMVSFPAFSKSVPMARSLETLTRGNRWSRNGLELIIRPEVQVTNGSSSSTSNISSFPDVQKPSSTTPTLSSSSSSWAGPGGYRFIRGQEVPIQAPPTWETSARLPTISKSGETQTNRYHIRQDGSLSIALSPADLSLSSSNKNRPRDPRSQEIFSGGSPTELRSFSVVLSDLDVTGEFEPGSGSSEDLDTFHVGSYQDAGISRYTLHSNTIHRMNGSWILDPSLSSNPDLSPMSLLGLLSSFSTPNQGPFQGLGRSSRTINNLTQNLNEGLRSNNNETTIVLHDFLQGLVRALALGGTIESQDNDQRMTRGNSPPLPELDSNENETTTIWTERKNESLSSDHNRDRDHEEVDSKTHHDHHHHHEEDVSRMSPTDPVQTATDLKRLMALLLKSDDEESSKNQNEGSQEPKVVNILISPGGTNSSRQTQPERGRISILGNSRVKELLDKALLEPSLKASAQKIAAALYNGAPLVSPMGDDFDEDEEGFEDLDLDLGGQSSQSLTNPHPPSTPIGFPLPASDFLNLNHPNLQFHQALHSLVTNGSSPTRIYATTKTNVINVFVLNFNGPPAQVSSLSHQIKKKDPTTTTTPPTPQIPPGTGILTVKTKAGNSTEKILIKLKDPPSTTMTSPIIVIPETSSDDDLEEIPEPLPAPVPVSTTHLTQPPPIFSSLLDKIRPQPQGQVPEVLSDPDEYLYEEHEEPLDFDKDDGLEFRQRPEILKKPQPLIEAAFLAGSQGPQGELHYRRPTSSTTTGKPVRLPDVDGPYAPVPLKDLSLETTTTTTTPRPRPILSRLPVGLILPNKYDKDTSELIIYLNGKNPSSSSSSSSHEDEDDDDNDDVAIPVFISSTTPRSPPPQRPRPRPTLPSHLSPHLSWILNQEPPPRPLAEPPLELSLGPSGNTSITLALTGLERQDAAAIPPQQLPLKKPPFTRPSSSSHHHREKRPKKPSKRLDIIRPSRLPYYEQLLNLLSRSSVGGPKTLMNFSSSGVQNLQNNNRSDIIIELEPGEDLSTVAASGLNNHPPNPNRTSSILTNNPNIINSPSQVLMRARLRRVLTALGYSLPPTLAAGAVATWPYWIPLMRSSRARANRGLSRRRSHRPSRPRSTYPPMNFHQHRNDDQGVTHAILAKKVGTHFITKRETEREDLFQMGSIHHQHQQRPAQQDATNKWIKVEVITTTTTTIPPNSTRDSPTLPYYSNSSPPPEDNESDNNRIIRFLMNEDDEGPPPSTTSSYQSPSSAPTQQPGIRRDVPLLQNFFKNVLGSKNNQWKPSSTTTRNSRTRIRSKKKKNSKIGYSKIDLGLGPFGTTLETGQGQVKVKEGSDERSRRLKAGARLLAAGRTYRSAVLLPLWLPVLFGEAIQGLGQGHMSVLGPREPRPGGGDQYSSKISPVPLRPWLSRKL